MHPQDTLLVAEALVALAGDARTLTPRERRAWELADAEIPREALINQIDEEWSGPD